MGTMNPKSAVIIGMDAISPLGIDLDRQWESALDGVSGVGPLTRFPLPEGFPVRIAGEVDGIDHLPLPFLKPREQAKWTSPLFKYALLSVDRALAASGITITPDIAGRTAVTYGSAIGGLDAVLAADRQLMGAGKLPHPFANPNACINMVTGKVSIHTGATGPITTPVSACATGAASMIIAAMLMAQGRADVAICGAVDFPLTAPIVAGFATMNGAYEPRDGEPDGPPSAASRPFSLNRRGFVVSEGAACLILATRQFAAAHGLRPLAAVAGWSMTSDAYHVVAPRRETVQRCMAEAVADAGIAPEAVDAVNAHAAATRIGDQVEFDAMDALFGGKIPPVTANKSLMGHAMGASSAIETVFALKGMAGGQLPPTINYSPDPGIPLGTATGERRSVAQEYVLKNAFGFGGCNACIVLRNLA
ncbi:MAG: beta-ketoacyl-[acyl-carrier-protein] synthase family protein [Pseudomonadota bacterium]